MAQPIVNSWEKRLFTLRAASEQRAFVDVHSDSILSRTYEMRDDAVVRTDITGMLSPKYYPPLFDATGVFHMPSWKISDAYSLYGKPESSLLHFWKRNITKPYNKVINCDLNSVLSHGNPHISSRYMRLLQDNHNLRVALTKADRGRQAEPRRHEQEIAVLQQKIMFLEEVLVEMGGECKVLK